jgi:threonine/homoserine/homoserine lactone efflux protein
VSLEHLIEYNVALLAAKLSPVPAFLIVVKTTLSGGRNAGIAVGCGLGLMASTWTLLALLGLDAVFVLFPWAYTTAKTIGALYLLHIAFKMWTGARKPIDSQARPVTHAFRQGFLVNLLNPKSVLFAAAVLIVVFPENTSGADNAVIVLNHLVIEFVFYATLASCLSSAAISRRYLRARLYIDRAASIILGSLGARLFLSR